MNNPSLTEEFRWEWDFSSARDFFPEECLRYELAREVRDPAKYFALCKEVTLSSGKTYMPLTCLSDGLEKTEGYTEEFWKRTEQAFIRDLLSEDFQNQKPEKLREVLPGLYFQHPDGSQRAYPTDLEQTAWCKLDPSWQQLLSLRSNSFTTGFRAYHFSFFENTKSSDPEFFAEMSKPGERQYFGMIVDWSNNDAKLAEDFNKWLFIARPEKWQSVEEIGRKSTEDSLNALSAMRLRHHLSVDQAIEYTRELRGMPLYGERSSWERAHKRAVALFRVTFPGAGEPKSATKASNRKKR